MGAIPDWIFDVGWKEDETVTGGGNEKVLGETESLLENIDKTPQPEAIQC